MTAVLPNPRAEAFWRGLATANPPELGQGPRSGVLPRERLLALLEGRRREYRLEAAGWQRLTATLLLYHDHHNEAHDLVQDLNDADGTLIHALLHRREPDFWNARYWFRQVGDHPVYRALTPRLGEGDPEPRLGALVDSLTLGGMLDPLALVGACEAAFRRPPSDPQVVFLRRLQDAEFRQLVEHLLG